MRKIMTDQKPNFGKKIMRFVGALSLVVAMVAEAAADEKVRINFRDADIRSVIESVAEITGKSFVLDPRVKGKVTIIAPEAIDADLLYNAALSSLQVQGFQAVDDGVVTRILPFNQAFTFSGSATGNNKLITKVIKIQYSQVTTLVPVLKPVMSSGSRLQAFAQSNAIVVTDIASNIKRLEELVAELDDPQQTAIEVVALKHISAGEAVHIATQLKQLQKQELSLVEDGMNNRIIVSGPSTARRAFKAMLRTLDQRSTKTGSVEVIYLNFARAAEMKPIVEGMLQSDIFLRLAGEAGADSKTKKKTAYQIQIDELNNALVIAAPSAVVREIRNVVGKLDRARPQVLIEAVIAELSEDQAELLNSQLVYTSKNRGGYLTKFDNLLATVLGSGADGDISDAESINIGNLLDATSGAVGIAGDFDPTTGKGIGLLIQALKTDGSTKILSTPSVVTLDNEEASLSVGEEVPFQSGSFTSSNNGSSNPFTTINREEVGVKLKVKPQISKGNSVRLEIEQESSKVKAGEPGLQTTSKSTMKTNVLIQDGELLILGGLIEDQTGGTASKVPLLGDIPLLGRLFRSTAKDDSQSVLMMFIRPTIIRTAKDARELSEAKYKHLIKRDLGTKEAGLIQPMLEEFINEGKPTK
jgi:general secretion pathway protein D